MPLASSTSLPHLSTAAWPGSASYVGRYGSIGVWQIALQKLGCSCQTQKPAPAAIRTTATTPTTIGHFFPFFLGAASPASAPSAFTASSVVSTSVVESSVAAASVAASTLVSSSLISITPFLASSIARAFRLARGFPARPSTQARYLMHTSPRPTMRLSPIWGELARFAPNFV